MVQIQPNQPRRLRTMQKLNANTDPTKSYRLRLGRRSPRELRKQRLLALPKCIALHRAVAAVQDQFSAGLATMKPRHHNSLTQEAEWPTRSKTAAAGDKSLLRRAHQPTPSPGNTRD